MTKVIIRKHVSLGNKRGGSLRVKIQTPAQQTDQMTYPQGVPSTSQGLRKVSGIDVNPDLQRAHLTTPPVISLGGHLHNGLRALDFNKTSKPKNIKFKL